MKTLRHIVQFVFLGLVLWVGLSLALGWSRSSVEDYCPMGGLAALPALLGTGRFSCSTGEANLAALVALVLLALLARKSFCAWLCPLGTVLEWFGRLGARLRGKRGARPTDVGAFCPSPRPDAAARWLRLAVLGVIVAATFATSELVFRPYCPYYSLASFHGHDMEFWSYGLLAAVLLGAVLLPLAWCRYLCPLGGALWPLARSGRLRIARAAEACTGCGRCDRACPHGLRPSTGPEVRSGECTLCLECRAACPEAGALELQARAFGWRRRVPGAAVPGLVGGLALAAYVGSGWFALPSYVWEPPEPVSSSNQAEVSLVVEGVRCVDAARLAIAQLEKVPGIVRVTAYASRHTLEVVYDTSRVEAESLRRALEAPLIDPDSGQIRFHVYKVRQIDGRAVGD